MATAEDITAGTCLILLNLFQPIMDDETDTVMLHFLNSAKTEKIFRQQRLALRHKPSGFFFNFLGDYPPWRGPDCPPRKSYQIMKI